MKKITFLISVLCFSILFSCKENEVNSLNVSEIDEASSILNAEIRNGKVHFEGLTEMKQTIAFLIENPDYEFESLDNNFKSFKAKRQELEQSEVRPSDDIFNKYFSTLILDGEEIVVSKITDEIFEKVVNQDGFFEINDEEYFFVENQLMKRSLSDSQSLVLKVSDLKVEIERLVSEPNSQLRAINGGGNFFCSGREYRLLGDLVNFNIGIYQRLSIQVKYQRKNQSFWSWIDPWLSENGSLFYNANFTIQPAGGFPPVYVNLTDNCGSCSGFNKTVDWNVGVAGPTQWSNQSGNFGGTVACGYRSYSF
ncbi:hypothetical protein SAMN06298216_2336 [Spirosomataceae bacterium TFI 002]|nr:hypothetical protein SAMN06298216_2336 [Spirosomataceae bacterium TFI 002]